MPFDAGLPSAAMQGARERYAIRMVLRRSRPRLFSQAKGSTMILSTHRFARPLTVICAAMLSTFALAQPAQQPPAHAEVKIAPIGHNDVRGMFTLEQTGQSVTVKGKLTGLAPGKHGLHIHEGRSCKSRGGHFTPVNAAHGAPDSAEHQHHLGDLGNVGAGPDGIVECSGVAKI